MNVVLLTRKNCRGDIGFWSSLTKSISLAKFWEFLTTITNIITTIDPRLDRGIFLILPRKIVVPDLKEHNRLTGLQVIANWWCKHCNPRICHRELNKRRLSFSCLCFSKKKNFRNWIYLCIRYFWFQLTAILQMHCIGGVTFYEIMGMLMTGYWLFQNF